MFCKKINRLGWLVLLPISLAAFAVDESYVEKWPVLFQSGLKDEVELPDAVEVTAQGGPLVANDKPSSQEELDRAAYWNKHGRRDLADKIRKNLTPATSKLAETQTYKAVPVAANLLITEPAKIAKVAAPVAAPDVRAEIASLAPEQPSPKDALERAKYWDERGRSDLADKIRKNLTSSMPKQAAIQDDKAVPVAANLLITEPAKIAKVAAPDVRAETVQAVPEKPSPKEALERVKYWDKRGRSDLADKAREQLSPVVSPSPVLRILQIEPVAFVAPQPAENVKPSAQQLHDQAQFWEVHGRSDLADQIRQKLQSNESAPLVNGRRLTNGNSQRLISYENNYNNQGVVSSSPEDSLLKNPNNMKTRLDLAQVYRSAGEIAKARVQIESVLTLSPDSPEALFASAQLYSEQRLWLETLHTLDKISPVSRTSEMGRLQKTAWAHVQIDRADALVRQGNNGEAELLLRRVAAELAINYNQTVQAEPPPLWKNETQKRKKNQR